MLSGAEIRSGLIVNTEDILRIWNMIVYRAASAYVSVLLLFV